MKKKLNIIWSILQVIIIIFVILVTVFVLCKNKYGYTEIANHNFSYISNEDTKYIKDTTKGDLLIIKKDSSIKQGDNIYYYVYKNKYTIRQAKIVKIEDSSIYISDSTNIDQSKVIGKSHKIIHKLGGIISFFETKIGFILFIILPLVIIFIYQVFKFISTIKEEKSKIAEVILDESNKTDSSDEKTEESDEKDEVEIL